jgi:hypothetical protein
MFQGQHYLFLEQNYSKKHTDQPQLSSYTRTKNGEINVLYAKLILTPYSNFGSVVPKVLSSELITLSPLISINLIPPKREPI